MKVKSIFIATLSIALLVLLPSGYLDSVDAGARMLQAVSIFEHHSISIPDELMLQNGPTPGILKSDGGQYFSKYGIGLSIAWTPLVMLASLLVDLIPLPFDLMLGFLISAFNTIVLLLTLFSLHYILRATGHGNKEVYATLLLLLAGTMSLPYANSSWSEPLVGLLLLWAFSLPIINNNLNSGVYSGLLISFVTLIKLELILIAPIILLLFKDRPKAPYVLAASVGLLTTLSINYLVRGDFLSASYAEESAMFGDPREAWDGLFWGLEKNLILFNVALIPGVLAWYTLDKTHPLHRGRNVLLGSWIVFILLYTTWHDWRGGLCFGPRFFVPLLPVTVMLSGPLLIRKLKTGKNKLAYMLIIPVLIFSLVLQLSGTSVKDHQAGDVALRTSSLKWIAQIKLLGLKLERGIRKPEKYRLRDFSSDLPDDIIDHTSYTTYQYLNHWWLLVMANKVRGLDYRS